VAIAWEVGTRVMIFEAVVPRVQIFPLSYAGDFYHFPMKRPFSEDALNYLLGQVGKKIEYSKWEGFKALFNGNDPLNKITQCAEIVKTAEEKNGVLLPGRAVPGDICNSLVDIGIHQTKVINEL